MATATVIHLNSCEDVLKSLNSITPIGNDGQTGQKNRPNPNDGKGKDYPKNKMAKMNDKRANTKH